MSRILIQQYLNQLRDLRTVSGTHREMVVREAFKDLLKDWARAHDLIFVPEYEIEAPTKERRYVDGALLYSLRVPFGYWEAKDEKDDLDTEIEFKFRRGYPQDNIIFEDSQQAVLFQNRHEVIRCAVDDVESLEKLLNLFFGYQRPEIAQFDKAVEQFKTDLPAVLTALREMIERAEQANPMFRAARQSFLVHAREVINPYLTGADVREMLIQHILTEELFAAVFPGTPFHSDNNVARELYKLEATFFTGNTKFTTLKALEPYYAAIRSAAAQISRHHEKQTFLKVIYENFYKVYNPKAADRLGVIYTPNEIVRFMVESADWLCEKHFRRGLIDKDVDILDPAAGTGTFICELIEHSRGQPAKLNHKYRNELHANEVAILPYYVANLNIEATYAAITGEYIEFPNLCFVDTLDNTFALRKQRGHMDDLFGRVSDINVTRIRRQNSRRISVIIGNPPYNANQLNENENNKNREYLDIDKRIKATYIAASTAQKTKLYDMYARFFRWASDRLDENGILAFITNRSFIERATFDGFRKCVTQEFTEIWVIDLGGDVRANPRLSGTTHNVFGIQTGVAISFMIRRAKQKDCRIFYVRRPELETADDKLAWLRNSRLSDVEYAELRPDAKGNWINQPSNDFGSLLPIASKVARSLRSHLNAKTLFRLYSLGISTNRDEWVYGESPERVATKMRFLISEYDAQPMSGEFKTAIKWSRNLKRRFTQGRREGFEEWRITKAHYRPFVTRSLYDSDLFIDEGGSKDEIFPVGGRNLAICFSDVGSRSAYCVLAVDGIADLHFGASVDAYQQVPLYRYTNSSRSDNVTDWALDQFRKQYQPGRGKKVRPITKEALFQYVYGVLYDPAYREKYALNLKREFPRIPFYADFWEWADWGKSLLDLHVGYGTAVPWKLIRTDVADERARKAGVPPKTWLKVNKEEGRILVDSETTLAGVPPEAWEYKLGTRCALEWILDQYKERKPKDPTVRANFNTYRFADYKEHVIDLLARVATVSVETQRIVAQMRKARR
jgi:predicted helicase